MPNFFDDILLEPGKKIGIGTDTPTEDLEVVGSVKINNHIKLSVGEHISTFSSDGSLIGDSNQTVPTEQAVKRYVDDQVDGLNTVLSSKADQTALTAVGDRVTPLETTLPTKADQTSVTTLTGQIDDILNTRLPLKADQTALTAVGDRVTPLETTLATKADQTDVDTRLNAKANLSGSLGQDFNANDLTVQGTLTVQGDMIARDVEHVAGSLAFGNEDADTITIHGVLHSNHSSGALEIDAPVRITGPLTVDDVIATHSLRFPDGTTQTTAAGASSPWSQAGSTISYSAGRVGIGTKSPQAPFHVSSYMAVGPFAPTKGTGGIDVTGASAELGFVRRTLTSWPRSPKAGDRFVWYNPDGTARLYTQVYGDVLTISPDGDVKIYDAQNRNTLRFDSSGANLYLGTNGTDGDLYIRDKEDRITFNFSGDGASLRIGARGNEGDLNIFNNLGHATITLDGDSGNLTVRGGLYVHKVPYRDRRNVQWDDQTKQICYDNSSAKTKENITPLDDNFAQILKAQAKTYTRPGDSDHWEIGYLAEELHELGLENLVYYDEDGSPGAINYRKISLYLVEIIKDIQQVMEQQEQRLSALEMA